MSVQLVSKIFNLCDHKSPTSQTDRQTDRRTDRRHAIPRPRICTKVHCEVKTLEPSKVVRDLSVLLDSKLSMKSTSARLCDLCRHASTSYVDSSKSFILLHLHTAQLVYEFIFVGTGLLQQCVSWSAEDDIGAATTGSECRCYRLIRPPGTVVPDGLLFYRRCFFSLGSEISEVPWPIAAKLCHMIAIWRQSLAKVGQLGGPPLKNFRGQKHAKFRSIFCNVRL